MNNGSKHGGRRSGLSATSGNGNNDESQIGFDTYDGGSQRSTGTSSLLPAPETTRPPQQLSSRSLISASSLCSITSVATAEEDETRRIAEQLQEDEMLRLAMEQSLNESGFNNVFRPDNHSPMGRSNRSITSVRSAPHGDHCALESIPGGPLNQSFHISRRRRQPARSLQPDYDDDMFDLSPRDESDEQPTPGAVAMLTPPPSLVSVDQKTPSVRAAIASFVERGIEPPFSDRQGAQREESTAGSRKQEPSRTRGDSESGRLISEHKREPMTVEVGLAASVEHDVTPPRNKETNRQRIEQEKARSFREQQRGPNTLEPGDRDGGVVSSQVVEIRRPAVQRGEIGSSRKHASNQKIEQQKGRPCIERDRDPVTVEVGLDGGSLRSHTTDRRRPPTGEENRALRVHPSRNRENETGRSSLEAKRNSMAVERNPVEVNSVRSQASERRRPSSERAQDNTIDDDKARHIEGLDSRRTSAEPKVEPMSVDVPSNGGVERNATHRSPPSSKRLHDRYDPDLARLDSENRTPSIRPRDPILLDVSAGGSSSVRSERRRREVDGGSSVRSQRGRRIHIDVDAGHERAPSGHHQEPTKVEPTRVSIFKSGDGETMHRAVRPEKKSAWKPVVTTQVEQSPDWPVLGRDEDQSGQKEPGTASSYDLSGAEEHLSPEELKQIEMALQASSPVYREGTPPIDTDEKEDGKMPARELTSENIPQETSQQHSLHDPFPTTAAARQNDGLSEEDSAAIANAILQADKERERRRAEEEKKSLEAIALLMQEEGGNQQPPTSYDHGGNVRTMTRAEYDAQQISAQFRTMKVQTEEQDTEDYVEEGYRMNSSAPQRWARRDLNSVVGPNHEVRTKHDAVLDGQANAHRLGLEENFATVGNKAFNSFKQSMKATKKGVATAGSGRAGSDAAGTRAGGLDDSVRVIISRAINNGIIEKCNGVVNEGKEAVVLHADEGLESDGFDVAIKVFKRIQEFRNRGEYVDGDPRYSRSAFGDATSREQLEIWAEKEFRNLMRAHNADVPVPAPLLIKENVVFMRFLGQDWPAPQLKDVDLPRGSQRWRALYDQVMDAVRRLYQTARLVHGDLSEYNILVVPARFLEKTKGNTANASDDELRAVLIDFAQAVDTRHMSARKLLDRDIDTILSFFSRKGVKVPNLHAAVIYVQTND